MKNTLLLSIFLGFSFVLTAQTESSEFNYKFGTIALEAEMVQMRTSEDRPQQFVVQFDKGQSILSDKLHYLGDQTYILRASSREIAKWMSEGKVKGWAVWKHDFKIHPDLKSGIATSPYLEVVFDHSFTHKEILQSLKTHNIPVVKQKASSYFMVIEHKAGVVNQLAQMDEVLFIHTGGRKSEPEDLRSKALHRSDLLEDDSEDDLGFDGDGVSVLVRDDGMVGPHLDFKGRLFNDPSLPFETDETHGDGVAGIIGAAGSVEREGRGMAPAANIYATQYERSFLDNTLDLHLNEHVLYTNSSYSDGCNQGYTPNAAEVDRQIYEFPTLLHIFSAGNSNNNDCGYGAGNQWGNITGGHKQAKNAIATANVSPIGEIMRSSSRGPATDGRIKPDIAANGHDNYSTDPNNSYEPFGGTSGAAPCVAGVAAQLNEAYRTQYGQDPNSALLKAAMLNSANDAGEKGPDFVYGFGLLDAFGAYEIIRDGRFQEATLAGANDTLEFPIPVPDNVERVKVMLYWPDAPSQPMALKALVNDLNLKLQKDGTEYLPLVLDHRPNRSTLDDPAVPGIDTLNNVEQVVIESPDAGDYIAQISAKEMPSLTQDFVLVYEYEYAEEDIDFAWVNPEPYSVQNLTSSKRVFVEWINNVTSSNQNYLSYSLDGGATWTEQLVFSSRNSHLLIMSDAQNGDSVLLAFRNSGFTDTLREPFYLGENIQPQEFNVSQICPTSGSLHWQAKDNATGYRVYALGAKYLELVGETTDTFITVDLQDINSDQLFAMSVQYNNQFWTERSDGRVVAGGLMDCPQEFELAMKEIRTTDFDEVYYCDPFMYAPEVDIENRGRTAVDSFQICYQLDSDQIICQWFDNSILPNMERTFTLDSMFEVGRSYDILKVWVDAPLDDYFYNDTLEQEVVINFIDGDLVVDSLNEKMDQLPLNARIINSDEETTWLTASATEANENNGRGLVMPNYFYRSIGEEDQIYYSPVSLDSGSQAILNFNYAYSAVAGFEDQLLLIAEEVCTDRSPDTLWNVQGAEFATASAGSRAFQPSSYEDWSNQSFDLSAYAGKSVLLSLKSINGYGNDIWIDNFSILPDSSYIVSLDIESSADTVCLNDEVVYTRIEEGKGISTRKWLIKQTGFEFFEDTLTYRVGSPFEREVAAFSENDYMVASADASVDFYLNGTSNPEHEILNADSALLIANAENVDSIIWTADDGYEARGEQAIYLRRNNELEVLITVTIYDACGDQRLTELVQWTSSTNQPLIPEATIYPNPGNDAYLFLTGLDLEAQRLQQAQIYISNMNGQLVAQPKYSLLGNGNLRITWPGSTAGGVFILELRDDKGTLISRNKVIRTR